MSKIVQCRIYPKDDFRDCSWLVHTDCSHVFYLSDKKKATKIRLQMEPGMSIDCPTCAENKAHFDKGRREGLKAASQVVGNRAKEVPH